MILQNVLLYYKDYAPFHPIVASKCVSECCIYFYGVVRCNIVLKDYWRRFYTLLSKSQFTIVQIGRENVGVEMKDIQQHGKVGLTTMESDSFSPPVFHNWASVVSHYFNLSLCSLHLLACGILNIGMNFIILT